MNRRNFLQRLIGAASSIALLGVVPTIREEHLQPRRWYFDVEEVHIWNGPPLTDEEIEFLRNVKIDPFAPGPTDEQLELLWTHLDLVERRN